MLDYTSIAAICRAAEEKQMTISALTLSDQAVQLEVPEEELIRRMLQRGKETGRADDNIDTITKRLKVYHEQTAPLREYYKQEGNYLPVEGSGDVDRIFFDIKTRINERT